MEFDDFKDLMISEKPDRFARHNLFDEHCFVFNGAKISSSGTYSEFRSRIADDLGINPRNIAIVGSAKFGWSMSPMKFGNKYVHGDSDIDIIIVSKDFYENCWKQLRTAYFNGYNKIRQNYRNDIFSKFLVIKDISNIDSLYIRELKMAMMSLNKSVNDFLMLEGKASYRIYSDWCDAELYHTKGIAELQEVINNAHTKSTN